MKLTKKNKHDKNEPPIDQTLTFMYAASMERGDQVTKINQTGVMENLSPPTTQSKKPYIHDHPHLP